MKPIDLNQFKRIGVLTGAGISAESGIPTFRGKEGYWKNHRPEELASPEGFQRDPALVWEWYRMRQGVVNSSQPNAGHEVIAALEERFGDDFLLVTQNVDGLHRRAGNTRLVEVHGNIMDTRCFHCERPAGPGEEEDTVPVPKCASCGGPLRPGVVWFGESLPIHGFNRATRFAMECDLFLVVGTSGLVYPAAGIPLAAKDAGAYLVEVNPEETPLSAYCNATFRLPAGKMEEIFEEL